MSGWHHHDRNVTLSYVLEGAFHLEYGPGGREHADVKAGQYFLMPPWVIHREGTATDEPCRVIFTRIGDGPPVVPVDGPEPG